MHPMILGSVQRRAYACARNALLHPSYVYFIYIYIYVHAFCRALLRVCTSTDCLSRTILPIDAALPHPLDPSWPDWIYSAAAFISRRGNPSQSVLLVPRTPSRAESHVLLLERSSRFFQLAKRLSPPSKCFSSFLADVDSIHTTVDGQISEASLLF